jgi:hypothetical protein
MAASPENPLHGRCGCGAVRFKVTGPFESARYCHCHNCQRRTGTSCSANARLPRDDFAIYEGEGLVSFWQPEGKQAKFFCGECGGHLYSTAEDADHVFVRLGAIEEDPGIRPQYRQWLSSAVPWEPILDDLPRFEGPGHA